MEISRTKYSYHQIMSEWEGMTSFEESPSIYFECDSNVGLFREIQPSCAIGSNLDVSPRSGNNIIIGFNCNVDGENNIVIGSGLRVFGDNNYVNARDVEVRGSYLYITHPDIQARRRKALCNILHKDVVDIVMGFF